MKITSFGEVLWDDLPSGKVLGGAPLNVLVRLHELGAECSIISSRGDDADGAELLRQVQARGVDTGLLQVCPDQATSLVKVTLDDCGVASYDIVQPCAWDRITVQPAAQAQVAASDAFIFGSLGTRDPVSRQSLETLLAGARFKVFDVNLRPPHYELQRVLALMQTADLVKLNDDELYEIAAAAGSPYHSIEQNIRFLAGHTGTRRMCVTMGGHGALYLQDEHIWHHGGFRVTVVDTVGSGDSFLAGLLHKLLNGAPPQEALAFACALGALVAARRGATPAISAEQIRALMHPA